MHIEANTWHRLLRKGFIANLTSKEIETRLISVSQSRVQNKLFVFSLFFFIIFSIRASFKGWGKGWYVEVLAGQVLIGELWNLAIYGKIRGFSTGSSWGQQTLHFWKGSSVQVPVMSQSFGSGCNWRSKLSLRMLQLHDLRFWFAVSEKQLNVLLETG